MRTLLPNPFIPLFPYMEIACYAFGIGGSGAWPSNDRALYVPVTFPADATLYSLMAYATATTGNYDLGLYANDFSKIISSGSTAISTTGVKTLTLPEMRVFAGETYYAALAASSTGSSWIRRGGASNMMPIVNIGQEASAVPLPDPATPAAPASIYVPIFAFGVR